MFKRLLLLLLLSVPGILNAQDPHFSDYLSSRAYLNPGMVGCDSNIVLSAGGRLQWPKVGGNYRTMRFSADNQFHFMRAGWGIDFSQDIAGAGLFKTSTFALTYAPHIELFDHRFVIQPGISIGVFQQRVDWSKLTFGDMIDPRRGFVYTSNEMPGNSDAITNYDIQFGIFMYTKNIYGGLAIHHLTQPNHGQIGPSPLWRRFTYHAGANLSLGTEHFILSPNMLVMKQKDAHQYIPGVKAKYKFIVAGLAYRVDDAMIGSLGFQNRFLRLTYSYDYTTSKLTNKATGGSHEVQMTWFLDVKKKYCKILPLRMI